jgi:radical SAM protein with 4Fe4S-binding SPASM domain
MGYRLDSPIKLWLQVNQNCNQRCAACYGDCGPQQGPDEWRTDELLAFIDRLAQEGIIQVILEGGEPLLRPDIIEVTRFAAERMLVWLRTNGTLVDDPMADAVAESGVSTVIVDVMCPDEPVHDQLTGLPGSFRRTIDGIRRLRQREVDVLLTMIMTRSNVDRLQELVDLAVELDVRRVGVLRLYPLGRARRNWSSLSVSLPDQMRALRSVRVPEGMKFMQSWHPNDGNCCWQNAGVDATGRSVGCSYLRDFVDFGNARETGLAATWNHPLHVELRAQNVTKACPSCESTQGSRGGCRSTAYAFHRDWSAPDPYCEEMNDGVDVRVLPA